MELNLGDFLKHRENGKEYIVWFLDPDGSVYLVERSDEASLYFKGSKNKRPSEHFNKHVATRWIKHRE